MLSIRIKYILGFVLLILAIPLIAMQFTESVQWSPMDFIIMFIMLFWTGLAGDLILRKVANKRNRGLLLIGTLLVFLILWAEMAVGIFGSPIAGS